MIDQEYADSGERYDDLCDCGKGEYCPQFGNAFDSDAGLIGRKYVKRVAELEAEGMTTSDAQAAADAEFIAADNACPDCGHDQAKHTDFTFGRGGCSSDVCEECARLYYVEAAIRFRDNARECVRNANDFADHEPKLAIRCMKNSIDEFESMEAIVNEGCSKGYDLFEFFADEKVAR